MNSQDVGKVPCEHACNTSALLRARQGTVLGWWERHEVPGEEELQLSCGRAPASPLGAAAGSDPGQQHCPGPWGFQWRSGPGEHVLPSPLWGGRSWAPGSQPLSSDPIHCICMEGPLKERLGASCLLKWVVWVKQQLVKHFGYYWSPPYQGEDFQTPLKMQALMGCGTGIKCHQCILSTLYVSPFSCSLFPLVLWGRYYVKIQMGLLWNCVLFLTAQFFGNLITCQNSTVYIWRPFPSVLLCFNFCISLWKVSPEGRCLMTVQTI